MKKRHETMGIVALNFDTITIADKVFIKALRRGLVSYVEGDRCWPIIEKQTNHLVGGYVAIKGRGIVVRFLSWLTDICRVHNTTEYEEVCE